MKRAALFAVIVSAALLAGFWSTRQVCRLAKSCCLKTAAQAAPLFSGLDPAKRKGIQDLENAFKSRSEETCMKICSQRLVLMRLLEDPHADSAAIHSKIDEIGALQIVLEKEIADHILEVKKYLDPTEATAYLAVLREQIQKAIRQNGFEEILKS